MLVLALAQHLFALLEATAGDDSSASSSSSSASSSGSDSHAVASAATAAGFGGLRERLLMWGAQPRLWCTPVSKRRQLQALLCALLFALHPVHTEVRAAQVHAVGQAPAAAAAAAGLAAETADAAPPCCCCSAQAVAGIVGCAELICAIWSLPALLLYFMAVDGRYAAGQLLSQQQQHAGAAAKQRKQSSSGGGRASKGAASAAAQQDGPDATSLAAADALQHWLLVVAAAGLALLAALSKEIGITVVGTMVLYDLLMAQHMLPERQQQQQATTHAAGASTVRRQLLRVLLLAAVAVGYVRLRQWVAVEQLVAIYRKVG